MTYETLAITLKDRIAHIEFNRPTKANAMTLTFWKEIKLAMEWADATSEVRVVVLSGRGTHFSSGIDLELFAALGIQVQDKCAGRMREKLRSFILECQASFTAIERCRKPVIAAIHGACIGAALDLVAACDLRYGTEDAFFSIKEIDIGMVADVGTLQRLPKLIPDGLVRELAYTGRKLSGTEAHRVGLVNRAFPTHDALVQGVGEIAATIAAKSPLSIRGSKEMILYARDHSVEDGLNYVATWNAAMLLSQDIEEAAAASREKRPAQFKD